MRNAYTCIIYVHPLSIFFFLIKKSFVNNTVRRNLWKKYGFGISVFRKWSFGIITIERLVEKLRTILTDF